MRHLFPAIVLLAALAAGCGTSKWTDTKRTATEQLLISDAMDRAVSLLDFRALAGKTVYLDDSPLASATDADYLSSLLRQHMLASGCLLRDTEKEADYVVEARAGAVGTDRNEVLFGVPAVNIPSALPVTGIPNSIPEMPLVKKNEQRAVTKLAVFAYNRKTGRPVWQSGTIPVQSTARDVWVLGAGPFQRGTIYDGTNFAGDRLQIPLINLEEDDPRDQISVAGEAFFVEPHEEAIDDEQLAADKKKPAADKTADAKEKPATDKTAAETDKKAPAAESPPSQVVPAAHEQPAPDAPQTPAKPESPPAAASTDDAAGQAANTPPAQPSPSTPPRPLPGSPDVFQALQTALQDSSPPEATPDAESDGAGE